jgi:hypothetical protein
VRAQQVRVGRGAGRDDARDFAAHQLLARAGFFHLVADGHAIAAPDQPRDVAFGRMIRHAAHRDGRAFFLVARGERDFEFARGRDGVFEEELVEIAEPEHQQRAGDLLLHGVVLPHQRRGCRQSLKICALPPQSVRTLDTSVFPTMQSPFAIS